MSGFTLSDFRQQLRQLWKLGPLHQLLNEMGLGVQIPPISQADVECELSRIEGIIDSMTPAERSHPSTIDDARAQRIACGSGTQTDDVRKLVGDFEKMARMMDAISQTPLKRRLNRPTLDPGSQDWSKFTRWRAKWKRPEAGDGESGLDENSPR